MGQIFIVLKLIFLAVFMTLLFQSCSQFKADFGRLPETNHIGVQFLQSPQEESSETQSLSSQNPSSPEPPQTIPQDTPHKLSLTFLDAHHGVKKVVHTEGSGLINLPSLPDGDYSVIIEAAKGFQPPQVQTVTVQDGQFQSLHVELERMEKEHFYYHWETDEHGREFEYSAHEDVAAQIEFLNEPVKVYDSSASQRLLKNYNMILSDEGYQWNYSLASRLLKTVDFIPHEKLLEKTKVLLTTEQLPNDIEVRVVEGRFIVTLSLDAFTYAEERLVKLNGKRGKFFSRRLFKALVFFFTENGENKKAVQKILFEKFAVTTDVPNHRALTGEDRHNFQSFHASELVQILHAFAEMPEGYYKIEGLAYLLRRKNGHPHPLYPNAAAVAWPRGSEEKSYIEFMDTAFIDGSADFTHRLLVHEKSHFLWRNVFSQALRDDWTALGRWYQNEDGTWATKDTTAFVSPYAHSENPNEDMAESLAHYVFNPKKLLSVAPQKFHFIEQRIMNGYRYVSMIRKDLTFEVLNLFPDYDFPRKNSKS